MPGFEIIDDQEKRAVAEVFDRDGVLFRTGFDERRSHVFKVREFELAFAQRFGAGFAHAVSSGTAAVKVALKALGVRPGDEVITQCFTFVATVEAILECGAIPICTEINRTLNMDPDDLAKKITSRTKAIVPVHMLGASVPMAEVLEVALAKGIPVIEDAAQACGGRYRGRHLGTLGAAGAYSFDFGKALTTGEGGMVVTDDEQVYLRARAYSDHGHESHPTVPRGEDTRSAPGFNYRMMELQGAIGLVQLSKLEGAIKRQKENKARIKAALRQIASIRFRDFADEDGETGDTLVFFLESPQATAQVARELLAAGVRFRILPEALKWHYAGTWDHMLTGIEQYRGRPLNQEWKRSDALLRSAIAIPIFIKMDDAKVEWTIDRLARALRRF